MMTDEQTPFEQSPAGRAGTPSRLVDSEFYRALAATERRRLLQVLLDGEEYAVDEVADVLREDADTRFRLKLRHIHLPLLDKAGLISYDHERRTVELRSLDPFIEDLIRWSVDPEQEPPT